MQKAKDDLLYVAKNDLKNKKAREELTAVKEKIKLAKQDDKVWALLSDVLTLFHVQHFSNSIIHRFILPQTD